MDGNTDCSEFPWLSQAALKWQIWKKGENKATISRDSQIVISMNGAL